MITYRYSRWDGKQDLFQFDEDDIMEELSEHIATKGDTTTALQSLIQDGLKKRDEAELPGVKDILEKIKSERNETLGKYNMESVLDEIKKRLKDIAKSELSEINSKLSELSKHEGAPTKTESSKDGVDKADNSEELYNETYEKKKQIQNMPEDPSQAVSKLQAYSFLNQDAKKDFDSLVNSIQDLMPNSSKDDLEDASLSARDRMQKMNDRLTDEMKSSPADNGQLPQNTSGSSGDQGDSSLQSIVKGMQQKHSLMQSLMKSMSSEMGTQVQKLLNSTFSDEGSMKEMRQLEANLESIYPMRQVRKSYPFDGDKEIGLEDAIEVMKKLQAMEELELKLKKTQHGYPLHKIDQSKLKEIMGKEISEDLAQLKKLANILEAGGYIKQVGNRFELTPKGMRKIGHKALQEIFNFIKPGRTGQHISKKNGQGIEDADGTKRYEFGDQFHLDINQTILNAINRTKSGIPVSIDLKDLEVIRTYDLSLSSTVVLIDLSLSMAMRGNFLASKKVALAMDSLIRSQFPRDNLYIVGFSTYAREIKSAKLALLSWDESDPYTNMQHGLMISQKLLDRTPGGTKQIIMISDGEPTAHFQDGELILEYPPSNSTIEETLREVKRCTTKGTLITTFMLDRTSSLIEFIDQVNKINKGRVFYTSPDRLGQYLMVDYITNRRQVIS